VSDTTREELSPELDEATDAAEPAVEAETAGDADGGVETIGVLVDVAAEERAEHDQSQAEDVAMSAEDAEAQAVRDFKSDLRMQDGNRNTIQPDTHYYNRVKTNIESRTVSLNMEEFIFEVQVPMEDVVEIKNGQRKQIRRVRIPGYVLVRMELTDE